MGRTETRNSMRSMMAHMDVTMPVCTVTGEICGHGGMSAREKK